MMEGLGSFNLIVKAPNQKIEDKRVACDRSWTVRQLKEHLSTVYPEKPHKDQQKLVYFGKLLKDESCLHEVLTQESYDDAHTVHLVCPAHSISGDLPRLPSLRRNPQQTITTQPSELRHRQSTATDSQPLEPPAQLSPQTSTVPPEHLHYWNSYWTQMQSFHNQQSDMAEMTPQQRLWLQMYQQQSAQYTMQMQHTMNQMNLLDAMGVGGLGAAPPAHPNIDVPEERAEAAPQADAQDEVVRMNAQGGLDAEGGQNDWLDTMYAFVRFAMLMMLLYFYTTFTRFAVVFVMGLFFYVARGNLFRPRRRRPPAQPAPQQNEQNQAAENQNNENNELQGAWQNAERTENNNNITATEEERTSWVGSVRVILTFIVTFFSSLIPQNPAAIAN